MKKIVLILIGIITIALISSCSDDKSTTPTNEEKEKEEEVVEVIGWPLVTGYYWNYNSYLLDENGNNTNELVKNFEMSIGQKKLIDGKEGYELIQKGTETTYLYSDKSGLYTYVQSFKEDRDIAVNIWLKTIDYNKDTWEVYSSVIDKESQGFKAKGTENAVGTKLGESKITYKGKSYDAINIQNIFNYDVTTTVTEGNEEPVVYRTIKNDTTNFMFVHGLGIYSSIKVGYDYIKLKPINTIEILRDHGAIEVQ